jgi:hypothetical protein
MQLLTFRSRQRQTPEWAVAAGAMAATEARVVMVEVEVTALIKEATEATVEVSICIFSVLLRTAITL